MCGVGRQGGGWRGSVGGASERWGACGRMGPTGILPLWSMVRARSTTAVQESGHGERARGVVTVGGGGRGVGSCESSGSGMRMVCLGGGGSSVRGGALGGSSSSAERTRSSVMSGKALSVGLSCYERPPNSACWEVASAMSSQALTNARTAARRAACCSGCRSHCHQVRRSRQWSAKRFACVFTVGAPCGRPSPVRARRTRPLATSSTRRGSATRPTQSKAACLRASRLEAS